jgi:hypothetical protein
MEEVTLNESAAYKTTNLGVYIKHSGVFFPKSYPSKPKKILDTF